MSESITSHENAAEEFAATLSDESESPRIADLVEVAASGRPDAPALVVTTDRIPISYRDLMRLVTRGLNRNERLIIILYYYEDMTMKEIGATLDLSESRVSQMHSSIVARLQQQLAKRRPEFSN